MPGATTAGGWGWAHQQARRRWVPMVESGECACVRCGKPIDPDEAWHLDHDDHDRTRYLGPAHARCNVVAGARKGAEMRGPRRLITSRAW